MISLNFHLRVAIKNILIFLEIELFGVINLNLYVSLHRTLNKGEYQTLSNAVILKWEI